MNIAYQFSQTMREGMGEKRRVGEEREEKESKTSLVMSRDPDEIGLIYYLTNRPFCQKSIRLELHVS